MLTCAPTVALILERFLLQFLCGMHAARRASVCIFTGRNACWRFLFVPRARAQRKHMKIARKALQESSESRYGDLLKRSGGPHVTPDKRSLVQDA